MWALDPEDLDFLDTGGRSGHLRGLVQRPLQYIHSSDILECWNNNPSSSEAMDPPSQHLSRFGGD